VIFFMQFLLFLSFFFPCLSHFSLFIFLLTPQKPAVISTPRIQWEGTSKIYWIPACRIRQNYGEVRSRKQSFCMKEKKT
jgi:hypothetical protein